MNIKIKNMFKLLQLPNLPNFLVIKQTNESGKEFW